MKQSALRIKKNKIKEIHISQKISYIHIMKLYSTINGFECCEIRMFFKIFSIIIISFF